MTITSRASGDAKKGNACKPHKLKRRLEDEVESHLLSTLFLIFLTQMELEAEEVKAHLVSRQFLEFSQPVPLYRVHTRQALKEGLWCVTIKR